MSHPSRRVVPPGRAATPRGARARMLWAGGLLACALLGAAACSDGDGDLGRPHQRVDRLELSVAGRPVSCELAVTDREHGRGLMGRTKLGPDEGMLFVYTSALPRTFWMRDTLIPLDIVFLDDAGTVLNVAEAAAGVEKPGFHSRGPARMVLELNRGWSARHGLEAGARVEVPAEILARAVLP